MPFLIDTNLVGNVRDWVTTPPANPDPTSCDDTESSEDTDGTDDAQGDLLISAFGSAIPMPGKKASSESSQADSQLRQPAGAISRPCFESQCSPFGHFSAVL